MRYLVSFACLLAALVVSPPSVSAQAGEEGGSALERWHPEAFVDPTKSEVASEPALQLELTPAGVDVAPSLPRTPDGYTLEEMDLRVKQSRRRLIGSAVVFGLGAACAAGAVIASRNFADDESTSITPLFSGAAVVAGTAAFLLGIGGIVGMALSGSKMAERKQERRRLQEAEHGTRRRVHWDLKTSRLMF
ncbi:MAG: hypothetical protein JRG70_01220 [Deltaproteobacteria bacterium]|nr:hypothetical protein [Deltaproteobacteria bacterium]